MAELQTQDLIDSLLNIEVRTKEEKYFEQKGVIPLGTRKPFDDYNGVIPEEDEVNISIPYSSTDNPLNIGLIDRTGTGKTRLTKNIVLALQKLDYNILIVSPKSNDWDSAKFIGRGRRIHNNQRNTQMKLVSYVPSYLEDRILPDQKKFFKLFSSKLSYFNNIEDWQNLGISPIASDTISSFLKREKNASLEIIEKEIRKHLTMQIGTKNSALTALSNLKNLGFFKYGSIPFKKEWENKNAVLTSFFTDKGGRMNVVIAKLIQEISKVGNEERLRGVDSISRKFIVFDDSAFYATTSDEYVNKEIRNVHHHFRSYGFNSLLIVQLPDLVDSVIIDGCTVKIIGNINNPEALRGKIPRRAYDILRNEELYDDDSTFTHERLLIEGNRVQRFFAYDCLCGHW